MAALSSAEMLRRLKSLVPRNWIAEFTLNPATGRPVAPVANAVLGGIADALTWVRGQGQAVRRQTRRAGTAGWLLDVDAYGFFGSWFLRRVNQSDDAFRKAYTDEVFRPKVTRPAIDKALYDLTGRHPKIVETWSAGDCGAYDLGGLGYAGSDYAQAPAGGYDASGAYDTGLTSYDPIVGPSGNSYPGVGCWGSLEIPYQLFVTAYRPMSGSIPNASGTDIGAMGYDIGAFRYTDPTEVQVAVSDADILACVARTQGAGVIAWTAISN